MLYCPQRNIKEKTMLTREELIEQNQKLMEIIAELQKSNEELKESIAYLTKQLYGRSSERTAALKLEKDQISFFDEAEQEANGKSEEAEIEEIEEIEEMIVRKKKKKGARKEDLADLPHEERVYRLSEEERICPKCGSIMIPIGVQFVRLEIEYTPASCKVVEILQESYECLKCRKDEETPVIAKAPTPKPLFDHSAASASAVAQVAYQKYVNALPLYRQEKDWKAIGAKFSRATMANWIIYAARDYLIPLVEQMSSEQICETVLHADETPVQVHREDGKSNTSKSYMWVYSTAGCSGKQMRIFRYERGRSSKYPQAYLRGFRGALHTDAYAGYDKIPGITRCLCWAHLRRAFNDALPPDQDKTGTIPDKAIHYINALFEWESRFEKLDPEERRLARQEKEAPLLDEFWSWLEELQDTVLPRGKCGKAVQYALKHKDGFMNFLKDGRYAISNNLAENAIRPFALGRKNWLFNGSPRGAASSAAAYSVIETAKANGIDPYLYLKYLFETMPEHRDELDKEFLDSLMPWNPEVNKICQSENRREQ